MAYDLYLTKTADKELAGLPQKFLTKVDEAINALADDPRPRGVVKLKGVENQYRVRVGDYRILYTVDDEKKEVLVITIGNRREVYRQL